MGHLTDPNIALQTRVGNTVIDFGQVGQSFTNSLLALGQAKRASEASEREAQLAPFRQQLLQAQVSQQQQTTQVQGQQAQRDQVLANAGRAVDAFKRNDIQGVQQSIAQAFAGHPDIQQQQLAEFQADPQRYINRAQDLLTRASAGQGTAAQREFAELSAGLSAEDLDRARRVELGLSPRATGSAAQTIARTGTAQDVAASQAIIKSAEAGATEEAKQTQQLAFKPRIAKAVALAKAEATARGETLTNLNQMKAALPGLNDVISQLRELAPIATSTLGGRGFDFFIKEAGFGSTKGADARAKFIAVINNQVLPLLKPTFGAAFTVEEGKELKATMGDPNATPSQKMEQLDAFIAQKVRSIETAERELGVQETTLLPGLPAGSTDNGDGTFTLPTGERVRAKSGNP